MSTCCRKCGAALIGKPLAVLIDGQTVGFCPDCAHVLRAMFLPSRASRRVELSHLAQRRPYDHDETVVQTGQAFIE